MSRPMAAWPAHRRRPAAVAHGVPVLHRPIRPTCSQAESDLATAGAQFCAADANEQRQHALYQTDGAALKDWQQAADRPAATAALGAGVGAQPPAHSGQERCSGILALERSGKTAASAGSSRWAICALVWLVANVREADAPKVHLGDRISDAVRVPAYPDQASNPGWVISASLIDPSTHRLAGGRRWCPNRRRHAEAPTCSANFDHSRAAPARQAPAVPPRSHRL